LNYLELRPLLATDGLSNQTKAHVASQQCAEATGQRVLPLHDGIGLIKAAKWGDRIFVTFLPTYLAFWVSNCYAKPSATQKTK
jgi:hypothetical protein